MSLRKILQEELSKADERDIKDLIDKALSDFSKDMEKEITKLIDKDRDIEKKIKDIVADVLEQYHKTLWHRRKQWSGAIK